MKRSEVQGLNDATSRQMLGSLLKTRWEAAMAGKAGLHQRWQVNEAYYRNQPPPVPSAIPGQAAIPIALVQPKIDALCAQTVRALLEPDTLLVAKRYRNAKRSRSLEQVLQFFFNIGGMERMLRRAAVTAGLTNMAVVRTRFDATHSRSVYSRPEALVLSPGHISYVGFLWDLVHPADFAAWPVRAHGIQSVTGCGHRFFRSKWEVESMQKQGLYFDDNQPAASAVADLNASGRDWSFSRTTDGMNYEETRPVELASIEFVGGDWCGLPEKMYRATISVNEGYLLDVAEYPYKRFSYSTFGFKPAEHGSLFPASSVAQDLQPLQTQMTQLWSLLMAGTFHSAFPALMGPGLGNKHAKYGPGDVIPTTNINAVPTSVSVSFNGQYIPMQLEWLERKADSVCRLSQAATGQQFKPNMTASEVDAIVQGQSLSSDDYLRVFASPLEDVAGLMCEMLYANWEVWHPLYAQQLPDDLERDHFLDMIRWEVHGASAGSSPFIQSAMLEKVIDRATAVGDVAQGGMFHLKEIYRNWLNNMPLTDVDQLMATDEEIAEQQAALVQSQQQNALGMDEFKNILGGGALPGVNA